MEFRDREAYKAFMSNPLAELEGYGLTIRVINALEDRLEIITVGEVLMRPEATIKSVQNVGVKGLESLNKSILKYYEEEYSGKS